MVPGWPSPVLATPRKSQICHCRWQNHCRGSVGGSASLDQARLNFRALLPSSSTRQPRMSYASVICPESRTLLGLPTAAVCHRIWNQFEQPDSEQQDVWPGHFHILVLRDAGRDHNTSSSPGSGITTRDLPRLPALFPEATPGQGDISSLPREIKQSSGGDISLLAPGGQLLVGYDPAAINRVDQGI